jgi:hypothetical protein
MSFKVLDIVNRKKVIVNRKKVIVQSWNPHGQWLSARLKGLKSYSRRLLPPARTALGPLRGQERPPRNAAANVQSQTFGGIRPALRARLPARGLPPHPGHAGASGTCSWNTPAETPRPHGTRQLAFPRVMHALRSSCFVENKNMTWWQLLCRLAGTRLVWASGVKLWAESVSTRRVVHLRPWLFPTVPKGCPYLVDHYLGAGSEATCFRFPRNITTLDYATYFCISENSPESGEGELLCVSKV